MLIPSRSLQLPIAQQPVLFSAKTSNTADEKFNFLHGKYTNWDKFSKGFKSAERELFEIIFRESQAFLYNYIQSQFYVFKPDLFEDLQQQTYLKLIKGASKATGFNSNAQVIALLCKIAKDLCTDELRKGTRRTRIADEVSLSQPWAEGGTREHIQPVDPENPFDLAVTKQLLAGAMKNLTKAQKDVMDLSIQGYTPTEIATMLGKPVGAIKQLKIRAQMVLRKALNQSDSVPIEQ